MNHTETIPRAISVAPAGLLLGNDTLPLLSGAIHYFQNPHQTWERCLDAAASLELPIIQSAVPWMVHERDNGQFDFGPGLTTDGFERDLGGFIEACAQRQLKLILCPGPQVNAELTFRGFPKRILKDSKLLARGPQGNQVILPAPPRGFPIPSVASQCFLQQVDHWLRNFGDFVRPYCWPDGPLIAIELDNELSFFYRTAAYDLDYHPDAVTLYRQFITQRYPSGLPSGYQQQSIKNLEPPKKMAAINAQQLAPHLDWIRFKEWMILRAVRRMVRTLHTTGCDRLVFLHNLPASDFGSTIGLPAFEKEIDIAGLRFFFPRQQYASFKRNALLAAGSSRLPMVFNLLHGCWPWWFPLTPEEQQNNALRLLMHGFKGFNLHMLVEQNCWYGSPVAADGSPHPRRYQSTKALIQAVKKTKLSTLIRPVTVAMVQVRDYQRLALCTSDLDPAPPFALDLFGISPEVICTDQCYGLEKPLSKEYYRTLRAIETSLEQCRTPYHILDSEVSLSTLSAYHLLVVPTFDFIDRPFLGRLTEYVNQGGILVLGPQRPKYDETLERLTQPLPVHLLADPTNLEPLVRDQIHDLGLYQQEMAPSSTVDVTIFQENGQSRVIFLANRTQQPVIYHWKAVGDERSSSALGSTLSTWDALSGAPLASLEIALDPGEVRMMICQPKA